MAKIYDLTGQRFGKLVALQKDGQTKHGATLWLLKCDCGGTTRAHTGELNAGKRNACNCGRSRPKHGMHDTRLYRVWGAMKNRCDNPTHPRYDRYGGRGITYCEEWQEFKPFSEWALANGYSDDLQIDRINNSGNYEPSNCRFVTALENMRNRDCSRREPAL